MVTSSQFDEALEQFRQKAAQRIAEFEATLDRSHEKSQRQAMAGASVLASKPKRPVQTSSWAGREQGRRTAVRSVLLRND